MFDELSLVKALPVLILQFLNYTRHPCVHSLSLPHIPFPLLTMIEIEKLQRESAFHSLLKQSKQFEINQNTISLQHDKEVLCMKWGESICGTQLCFKFQHLEQWPRIAFPLHFNMQDLVFSGKLNECFFHIIGFLPWSKLNFLSFTPTVIHRADLCHLKYITGEAKHWMSALIITIALT